MFVATKGKCPYCNREDIAMPKAVTLDDHSLLLKLAANQLKAWHKKYGENNPAWLPPSGDVRLLEAIAEALTTPNKGE